MQRFYQIYKKHLTLKSEKLAPIPSIGGTSISEDATEKEGENNQINVSQNNDSSLELPLMEMIYSSKNGQKIKDSGIKSFGWIVVGGNISSSKSHYDIGSGSGGNAPTGYYNYPNQILLNQAVLNLEKIPQNLKDKTSYGFRVSGLYGTDYQHSLASHFFSNQLIKNRKKYGFDPILIYGDIYFPKVAKGLNVRVGRYFSLQDIESIFPNSNYTYSHSMLNTFDPYTHQGSVATLKLNKNWKIQFEIFNGSDTAINDRKNNRLSLGTCARFDSDSGGDSFYPCVSGLNGGKYSYNNSQMYSANWYHKFNTKLSMASQIYHMWQDKVPNINNQASPPLIAGTRFAQCKQSDITCKASVTAFAHYLIYQFKARDFLTLRNDLFKDNQGQRSGYKTLYSGHNLSWTHWVGDVVSVRPELRFDYAFDAKTFDGGKRKEQYIFATDIVAYF